MFKYYFLLNYMINSRSFIEEKQISVIANSLENALLYIKDNYYKYEIKIPYNEIEFKIDKIIIQNFV